MTAIQRTRNDTFTGEPSQTPYGGDWGPEYAPEKPLNVASAPQRGASFHSRRRKSQRPIGECSTPYRGVSNAL